MTAAAPAATAAAGQYSLPKILGIWALAALPMGVLRASGLVAAWDLVMTGPARLLEITATRLAATQGPVPPRAAPADGTDAAAPAGRGKWWRGGG